jgi:hypothetical protein
VEFAQDGDQWQNLILASLQPSGLNTKELVKMLVTYLPDY